MKKTIYSILAVMTAVACFLAVSCSPDDITVVKPTYINSDGIPVVSIKTEHAAGVPADKIRGTDLLLEVMELSLAAAEETEENAG